ncbi:MAG: hypothetical protein ISN28_01475 [Ectothiorhodospiraceae bacterium AqS1]|nr:hypothetical protein [Ectothiorhodospiraceae bacterium AqS1]
MNRSRLCHSRRHAQTVENISQCSAIIHEILVLSIERNDVIADRFGYWLFTEPALIKDVFHMIPNRFFFPLLTGRYLGGRKKKAG